MERGCFSSLSHFSTHFSYSSFAASNSEFVTAAMQTAVTAPSTTTTTTLNAVVVVVVVVVAMLPPLRPPLSRSLSS